MVFRDRTEAGQILAGLLKKYAGRQDFVVLALPRGGVPVAYEIATSLELPMDIFVVRKLGVPGHAELAMGAIASGGVRHINDSIVDALRIDSGTINAASMREEIEIRRRERLYREERPAIEVRGKSVILVDDGLATGATMRVAVNALQQREVARIIVAVPAGAPEICREIAQEADEAICATEPESFHAVSLWYREFEQTTDEEVQGLLRRAWLANERSERKQAS